MVRPGIIPARAGFTPKPKQYLSMAGGSSPRVRGLRAFDGLGLFSVRIIPARAGFTGFPWGHAVGLTDHPRACGVYALGRPLHAGPGGSSPRVRGLPQTPTVCWPDGWIIPARAGFTGQFYFGVGCVQDHPRACGVYRERGCPFGLEGGSSPRVRGLLSGALLASLVCRIIPARAGFTWSQMTAADRRRDHPRACGVY